MKLSKRWSERPKDFRNGGRFPQYDLAIDDPEAFSKIVEAQALNLLKAGQSLAKKLGRNQRFSKSHSVF